MSQFIGKTCPYCKTPFKEGDDVVICSICEMPHHKECWVENQECTTFGCTGTIQGTSAKSAGLAFCPYCGTPHNIGDAFCGTCGNSLNGAAPARPAVPVTPVRPVQQTYTQQQTYTPPQPLTGPLDDLIVENTQYYNKKFYDMDSKNSKVSWNWAAFLISPLWCIYRKMYILAAAMFITPAIFTSILGFWGTFLAWGGYVAFGLFANFLYREHLKKIKDFASHISEPAKSKYLKSHTGAEMGKAAIICVIACVVTILLGI